MPCSRATSTSARRIASTSAGDDHQVVGGDRRGGQADDPVDVAAGARDRRRRRRPAAVAGSGRPSTVTACRTSCARRERASTRSKSIRRSRVNPQYRMSRTRLSSAPANRTSTSSVSRSRTTSCSMSSRTAPASPSSCSSSAVTRGRSAPVDADQQRPFTRALRRCSRGERPDQHLGLGDGGDPQGGRPRHPQRVPRSQRTDDLQHPRAPRSTNRCASGPAGSSRDTPGREHASPRAWRPRCRAVTAASGWPPEATGTQSGPRAVARRPGPGRRTAAARARRGAATSGRSGPGGGRAGRGMGVVPLGVHHPGPRAHPLRQPGYHHPAVAGGVGVHEGALRHPGEDLGVGVRVVGEPPPGQQGLLVEHDQRPVPDAARGRSGHRRRSRARSRSPGSRCGSARRRAAAAAGGGSRPASIAGSAGRATSTLGP